MKNSRPPARGKFPSSGRPSGSSSSSARPGAGAGKPRSSKPGAYKSSPYKSAPRSESRDDAPRRESSPYKSSSSRDEAPRREYKPASRDGAPRRDAPYKSAGSRDGAPRDGATRRDGPYKASPYKSSSRDEAPRRASPYKSSSSRDEAPRREISYKPGSRDEAPRREYKPAGRTSGRDGAPREGAPRRDYTPRAELGRQEGGFPYKSYTNRDETQRRDVPYKKASPYKASSRDDAPRGESTYKSAPRKPVKPHKVQDSYQALPPKKVASVKPAFEAFEDFEDDFVEDIAPVKAPVKAHVEKLSADKSTPLIYGLHAVRQAWLNPERRCTRLLLTDAGRAAFDEVLQEAQKAGLTRRPQPQIVLKEQLDKLLPGAVHQGIVLDAPILAEVSLEDVLRASETRSASCIVVLDQVTDPHNVGAILRSAAAFGALAVIMPERNAPPLTGVLAKTASGAADIVPMVRVNNLGQALDQMREAGFWSVGFAETGKETLAALDLSGKIALVMGAEGEGLRRLTMERCDIIARLPTVPPIGSLNVSNAAAVALYEFVRRNPPVVE